MLRDRSFSKGVGRQDHIYASLVQNIISPSAALLKSIFPISLFNDARLSDDEHVSGMITTRIRPTGRPEAMHPGRTSESH